MSHLIPKLILGIETSCDETAAAVVMRGEDGHGKILSNIVWSQSETHAPYGGVVPEIAARAHTEVIDRVVNSALREAGIDIKQVSAIATTAGPGLIGGLVVGLVFGKAMAASLNVPFLAVNHLEGHALTPRLTDGIAFPYLLLLVSGGHTQILIVEGVGQYTRLGTTLDDAVGEAFDKVAKLLGLGYPGGPEVEARAKLGDASIFPLPKPLAGDKSCNFSFAGLKSAVRMLAEKHQPISEQNINDICASFQAVACKVLVERVERAILLFREKHPHVGELPIAVAGGVAANQAIGGALQAIAVQNTAKIYAPPLHLCSDNGAMIAWAGLERLEQGLVSTLVEPVHPRWPLDAGAVKLPFAGVKG